MNRENFLNQSIFKILIILSVCLYFLPNFQAHDRIGPQWFGLSIVNILVFFYLIYIKKSILFLTELFSNKVVLFYSLFLIFSFASIINSENLPESIITFSNYFSTFFCFTNLIILNKLLINPKKFFVDLVLLMFIAEISLSFYPMIKEIYFTGLIYARNVNFSGAAANINVTAFSIVMKLPFAIYHLEKSNKLWAKIFILLLISISFFVLIILNSRGAFLGTLIILLIYFISIFFLQNKFSFNTKIFKISFLTLAIFIPIFISNIFLSSQLENKLANRLSTISFDTVDGSVNQRLRYYKQALTSISKNIFLGIGIGNWKLKSIEYDSNNISQYIIPYHAHNDYLQIAAESGILAFGFYVIIFIVILLMLYNLYLKDKEDFFVLMIFCSILVYLFDSLFNFPIARPISQLFLIFIFSIVVALSTKKTLTKLPKKHFKIIILGIILFFSSLSIYSSYKNYKSLEHQWILWSDYMGLADKKYFSTKNIDLVQDTFPNLTATALPINVLKAIYFIQEEEYHEAIRRLSERNDNPYVGIREAQIGQAYHGLKNSDSAYKYYKIAFNKLKNNESHSTNLINQIRIRQDINELDSTFNSIENKTKLLWKAYINAKSEIVGSGNKNLIRKIDSLIKIFPDDIEFLELKKVIKIGKLNFLKTLELVILAEKFFKDKKYEKAIEFYNKVLEIDSVDAVYYQNIALSYQKLKDTINAYKYFDIVIDSLNPKTGKSEFYKGVNLIKDKEFDKGCNLLNKSLKYGFGGAREVFNNYCN